MKTIRTNSITNEVETEKSIETTTTKIESLKTTEIRDRKTVIEPETLPSKTNPGTEKQKSEFRNSENNSKFQKSRSSEVQKTETTHSI